MWEKFIKIDKPVLQAKIPVGWNKHVCWKSPQNNNPVGWNKQCSKLINLQGGINMQVGKIPQN